MAKQNVEKTNFNRGLISPLALGRTDVKRVGLAAELMTNWMPRTLGPMSLRPGLKYTGATHSNLKARQIPFVFSITDTAIIEMTDLLMRVRVSDTVITRASVATAVANDSFAADVTSWTDADAGTATSVWRTGGYLDLLGDGTNAASRTQAVAVAGGDQNVEHAMRVVVAQGAVLFRLGSTAGGDELISETTLTVGTHSLAFTPTGANIYVQLSNRDDYSTLVASCSIEGAGAMTLPTPYDITDMGKLRYEQSGDVIFLAEAEHINSRIERRGTRSWSIVDFASEDGPYRTQNLTPVTMTPSALVGEITLTASRPSFSSGNVKSLYRLTSTGQTVTKSLGAADVYSDPILVTGMSAVRGFTIDISGTWSATITLQRSVGSVGSWTDVTTYTANQTLLSYNDALDNQTIYYRIGIKVGNYTSGTASASLAYAFGAITGVVKVTAYTSSTVVTAVVLKDLGALSATSAWAEGAWSARRSYPSSVVIDGGRLWWAGKDKVWASVSDAYSSHDPDYEGDAGPINRSIGSGPIDTIAWMVSAPRLLVGAQAAEKIVKSTTIDEPVTPTNFNMKDASTYGSAEVAAVKIDTSAVFVDRSGVHAMEIAIDSALGAATVSDLTTIVPEVCEPMVVVIAVQRRPDTRIHFVRSDGKVAVLVFDKAEDVKCWCLVETDGYVEDAVVMPGVSGDLEDAVYYTVRREVNGATVRYLEKWALISECVGGNTSKQADSFYHWTGASSTTVTGLTHLIGRSVVCWANGKDQGTFTVSAGGEITLPEAASAATVGLTYMADYKSTKLAYAAQGGSALTQPKRVDHLGLVLYKTHYQGLQYGVDFDYLDDLPLVEEGTTTSTSQVWESYDADSAPVNGDLDTDTRLCLRATAPRPCTVLAAVITMTTNEKN